MSYPLKLDNCLGKLNWSHEDVFEEHPFEFINAFVHHNYAMRMHTHSFYEVNIILSGTGRHYMEEYSCPVAQGYVFVIPPGFRHGYWQEDSLEVYHILISRAFFERYAAELKTLPGYSILFGIEPWLRTVYKEAMYLKMDEKQMEWIGPQLDKLLQLCNLDYEGKEVLKNAATMEVIGQLCHFLAPRSHDRSLSKKTYVYTILQSMEYIQQHLGEKITVDGLAGQCHMSRPTFLRHFEKLCRCSPMQYLKTCRIRQAKEWLLSTEKPLSEITQDCGFYDNSHFTKTFLKEEGVNPLRFRQEN